MPRLNEFLATSAYEIVWSPVIEPLRGKPTIVVDEAEFTTGGVTQYDPVIKIGYNALPGGVENVPNEGLAIVQIEGNFINSAQSPTQTLSLNTNTVGATGTATASTTVFTASHVGRSICYQQGFALITAQAGTTATVVIRRAFPSLLTNVTGWQIGYPLMETFFQYSQGGNPYRRPFFTSYDKSRRVIFGNTIECSTDIYTLITDRLLNVASYDTGGVNDQLLEVNPNQWIFRPLINGIGSTTGVNTFYQFNASKSAGSVLRLDTKDSVGVTERSFQVQMERIGVNQYYCRFHGPSEAGGLFINNYQEAGYTKVLVGGSSLTSPAFGVDGETYSGNFPIVIFQGKTGSAQPVLQINGGVAAAAVARLAFYNNGHMKVKDSGGTVQSPGVGTASLTAPTYTNKPGTTSPAGNPTWWNPTFDTTGALGWYPVYAH